jgi:peptidoglycan hydrolase-like protein with peptidoglycan-binding domain
MKPSHSYFTLQCAAAAAIALLFTPVLVHSQSVVTNGRDNEKPKSQTGEVLTSESAVRRVQLALQRLGYYTGAVDGFMGEKTQVAIAKFQVDHSLPVRTKITHRLLALLERERPRAPGTPEWLRTLRRPQRPEVKRES